MKRGEKSSEKKTSHSIGAYAVQCGICFKWRLIPTQDEYETIREKFIEDPWVCSKKANVSCDDPGDLEYDTSRLWVIDKPNIPKTPHGLERTMVMRSDFSKLDVSYTMPNGKKIRGPGELDKFLEANPQYKGQFAPASLNYTVPKIIGNRVPRSAMKSSMKSNKRVKKPKDEND